MNFKYENTLILFGRSPFINSIRDYIPALCSKYHTIGCNYFVNTFSQVEYVIFFDDLLPNVNTNHTIITNVEHSKNKGAKCYKLLNNHSKCELYKIEVNADCFSDKSTLYAYIHTPSIALNWAYIKKFKNVILAGIDLSSDNRHFDSNVTPDKTHNLDNEKLLQARHHIEAVAQRYLNIYQLNPDSDINVPKVNIRDLV